MTRTDRPVRPGRSLRPELAPGSVAVSRSTGHPSAAITPDSAALLPTRTHAAAKISPRADPAAPQMFSRTPENTGRRAAQRSAGAGAECTPSRSRAYVCFCRCCAELDAEPAHEAPTMVARPRGCEGPFAFGVGV
ncbi:hypothetical protein C2E23DRAFT_401624 [Lenzites betulinus]|nr:hypothetical protein C2E23DRAFT_401624 [Lenzites betulinus]